MKLFKKIMATLGLILLATTLLFIFAVIHDWYIDSFAVIYASPLGEASPTDNFTCVLYLFYPILFAIFLYKAGRRLIQLWLEPSPP